MLYNNGRGLYCNTFGLVTSTAADCNSQCEETCTLPGVTAPGCVGDGPGCFLPRQGL
jgi:hypothetical protein